MLIIKEINKIKDMYYEKHYSVTFISRSMKISKSTLYKYLKSYNFSPGITIKHNSKNKSLPYKDIVVSYLEEDRKHHHKQRHTARRAYDRLKEEFSDFDASLSAFTLFFRELKQEVFQLHNGYLPLSHSAGECQVDLGECSYELGGNKIHGYNMVATFPYSNASYCSLLPAKNTECILYSLKQIFEYICGVPHTIWFDNDTALVSIKNEDTIIRYFQDTFIRFKLHYNFKDVFCSPRKGNEKGCVEAGIRYMRRNLLVPVPSFDNLTDYNKLLLDRATELHNRAHYITEQNICDMHFEDLNELNPLPQIPFEVSSIKKRKLDNMGRIYLDNKISYFISPTLAYKTIQIKVTNETISFYTIQGELIGETTRIYSKNGSRYINPKPYLELLLNKPNAILNFDLSDIVGADIAALLISLTTEERGIKIRELISQL